jgi:hypothetical protein
VGTFSRRPPGSATMSGYICVVILSYSKSLHGNLFFSKKLIFRPLEIAGGLHVHHRLNMIEHHEWANLGDLGDIYVESFSA